MVEERARLRQWLSALGTASSSNRGTEQPAGSKGAARPNPDTVECAPAGAEEGHKGGKKATTSAVKAERAARKRALQLQQEALKVQRRCQQAGERYEKLTQKVDRQVREQLVEIVKNARGGKPDLATLVLRVGEWTVKAMARLNETRQAGIPLSSKAEGSSTPQGRRKME